MSDFDKKYTDLNLSHYMKRGLWVGFFGGFTLGLAVSTALYISTNNKEYISNYSYSVRATKTTTKHKPKEPSIVRNIEKLLL